MKHDVLRFAARALPVVLLTVLTSSFPASLPAQSTKAPQEDAVQLEEFVVSTGAQKGYLTTATTTAMRTNTPIIDLPSTIGIVNRELLDDTGVFEFRDAAVFISGVSHGYEHSNLINVRGSAVRNPLLNTFGYGTELPLETALIDRVEIIKGPNSVLAPSGLAGGDVNAVLKEPMAQSMHMVRPIFGNYVRRAEYDSTGPLTSDGKILYRVAGAVENSEGYRDYFNTKRESISPSLTWFFNPSVSLTVVSAYSHGERLIDSGLPIVNGKIAAGIPRTFSANDENFTADETMKLAQFFLRMRLSNAWKAQVSGSYIDNDVKSWAVQSRSFNATTGEITRGGFVRTYRWFDEGLKVDVVGEHDFGMVQNKLQLGVGLTRGETDQDRQTASNIGPVNAYTGARADPSTYVFGTFNPFERSESEREQTFIVDQVSLLDGRLIANAGVTWAKLTSITKPLPGAANQTTTENEQSGTTKQYGAVFKPTDDISVYYGFSQNFRGRGGFFQDGSQVGNSFGEQKEGGVKAYLYKQQVFATASVYEIAQTNQTINDPNGGGFQVPVGDLTVEGFEFDINAYFENGFSVIVTYSQLEAPLTSGKRARTVPEKAASFWSKYKFQDGPMKGWSLGLSSTYRGDQFGDVANTENARMPAVTLWNGFVGWERENLAVHLNLNNLTDEDYIRTGVNVLRHQPGDPFNVRAVLTYKF